MQARSNSSQLIGLLPHPVILGSALNAYGIIRSLGEEGIKSIVADSRFGMAAASRYVFRKLRLPDSEPTEASIETLFGYARGAERPPVLIPTNEAWVAAIAHRREAFDQLFSIPLPSPETSRMAISKDAMHIWCLQNDVRVPHTEIFEPGGDWHAFVRSAKARFPVIVKPRTKRADEKNEEIGFSTRVFRSVEEFEKWGNIFGDRGPRSGTIWQRFLSGPTTNITAFHGYRAKDGRIFMAGLTKLRIQPPVCGGSTSAAYMRADEEAKIAAQQLLQKLDYDGFFDLEFMRNDEDGHLYFIELNPRPGLPNYGATATGVNFVWEGYADQIKQSARGSKISRDSDYLWVRLFADFFLYVVVYRAIGFGLQPKEWWRTIKGRRLVDASLNIRDPLVIVAGAIELGLSAVRRSKRALRASSAYR